MRTIQAGALAMALLVTGIGAGGAFAQDYPTKPIRLRATGAGGVVDIAARFVAAELGKSLGQPVVVENLQANASLATGVANAAPDGYTLLVWGPPLWVGPLLEPASYDPLRDLAPISSLTRAPYVLVVTDSLPVRTVADLIKLAKSKPGELNYSSSGEGSSSHIAGELFKSFAGVDMVRVNYKAGNLEVADLVSGRIHMNFSSVAKTAAQVKAGKLRAIATAGAKRSSLLPDLPTIAETVPGFETDSLLVMMAPGKTPPAIVRRLNQETVRVLDRPEARDQLMNLGMEPAGSTSEQLAEAIKSDMARVTRILKNIKPQN